MAPWRWLLISSAVLCAVSAASGAEGKSLHKEGESPEAHLPPHLKRVTWFGERADWSHDGERILFVEKTFGDVYEVELKSGIIRPMTQHYPHYGYTRALYLANGDILLFRPRTVQSKETGRRSRAMLAVRAGQEFGQARHTAWEQV